MLRIQVQGLFPVCTDVNEAYRLAELKENTETQEKP